MPIFTTHTSPLHRIRRAAGIGAIAALALTGCGLAGDNTASETTASGGDDNSINLIVTESTPYVGPTEIAEELLTEEGWDVNVKYVTDIIQPNAVVSQGEYDANFFQHPSYLRQFNKDNKDSDVVPAFSVYRAPGGIFSLNHDSLEDLPDGATISLPVDTANNGRGLRLLADEGLLEVDDSVPVSELSQRDILDNPKNFEFVEVDQQSLAQTLSDVDAGFAIIRLIAESGHDVDDTALILEDDEAIVEDFTVIIGVKPENLESEKTKALQEAYQSPEVEQWFIDNKEVAGNFVDFLTIDTAEEFWTEFSAE